MLTPRQKETIENLKYKNIHTPQEVVKYCVEKLTQPSRQSGKGRKHHPGRTHSKEYYHQIINHIAQGGSIVA